MSYRNFRDLDLLRQMEMEMSRIADDTLRGFYADVSTHSRFWQPRVDVHETPEEIVVKAEISGVKPERLSVVLSSDDRVLTISGERSEEDGERAGRIRCYQLEITFGQFERQIALPASVRVDRNQIAATCRDGFLVVHLPKRTGEPAENRTIEITD
jgi:HSP20 family protein